MDRAIKILAGALLITLIGAFGVPNVARASQILGVSFDAQRGGVRIRVNGSGKVAIKRLENPRRLLIDIPQSSLGQGNLRLSVKDPRVKAIRVGQFSVVPAIVRVVVDLNESAAINPILKSSHGEIFVALSEDPRLGSEAPASPAVKIAVKVAVKIAVKPITVIKVVAKNSIAKVVVKKKVIKIVKHSPMPAPFFYPIEGELGDLPPALPETPPSPLPTSQPTPSMFFSTPEPLLTPPEPTPSTFSENQFEKGGNLKGLSSLQLVWQKLDVRETYPIPNADATYAQGTTYGVLTGYQGMAWKHWFNDRLGLSLEGRMASFKLIDRITETANDRSDITAHPAFALRYSMGMLQPEASLGYLYRSTTVKANADLGNDLSVYPTTANLTLMGPTLGGGVRLQFFQPLALYLGGYLTPFTTVISSYEKQVKASESTFSLTPLGDSRMTIQALLNVEPLQFSLGGYLEGINGKADASTGRPAYKQTNNGITMGVGFCY